MFRLPGPISGVCPVFFCFERFISTHGSGFFPHPQDPAVNSETALALTRRSIVSGWLTIHILEANSVVPSYPFDCRVGCDFASLDVQIDLTI